MMAPEWLYAGAGAVAIAGAIRKEGRWPANGVKSVLTTALLVLVVSALDGTRLAPLLRAIGALLLMAAVYAAVRANARHFVPTKKK